MNVTASWKILWSKSPEARQHSPQNGVTIDEMVPQRSRAMDTDQYQQGEVQRQVSCPQHVRKRLVLGNEVRQGQKPEVYDLDTRRGAKEPARKRNHQQQGIQRRMRAPRRLPLPNRHALELG